MAHHLKLFIRDDQDVRFLIVSDVSQFDESMSILNPALFVQLPGFDDAVNVPFVPRNTQALDSQVLQVCPDDELEALPDGLYTLTYSVAPNDKVQTVVYYYRTAQLENILFAEISRLHVFNDPHTIDGYGNVVANKKEDILLRAVLLLQALKANLCQAKDYAAAKNSYDEITKMLAALKCL